MVMLVNAALADLFVQRAPRRVLPAGLALRALLSFGIGWERHIEATPASRVLRVAIVQPNYTLEEKQRAGRHDAPDLAFAQRRRLLARSLPGLVG